MDSVLMRLAMLGGPFKSDEDVEVINWLANRELHRRLEIKRTVQGLSRIPPEEQL